MPQLWDDRMLGEQGDVGALVETVCEHLETDAPGVAKRGILFVKAVTAALVLFSAFIVSPGYLLLYPAIMLSCVWLKLHGGGFEEVPWAAGATAAAAGFAIARLPILDAHPWLLLATDVRLPLWGDRIRSWYQFVVLTQVMTAFKWGILISGLTLFLRAHPAMNLGLLASLFVCGALWPSAFAWAYEFKRLWTYSNHGMKTQELELLDNQYPAMNRRYKRWLALGSARLMRSWRQPIDRVFISYAWKDEAESGMAARLDQTLCEARVHCFFDRRSMPGRFNPWRAEAVAELLSCTHLFVVVGPHAAAARTQQREVETALQRWETEVPPAVVCVVDPGVSDRLRNECLPHSMMRVLSECPRLAPAKALDRGAVLQFVRRHRYQGLVRDWQTLLWPRQALRRWFRTDDISGQHRQEWLSAADVLGATGTKEFSRLVAIAGLTALLVRLATAS